MCTLCSSGGLEQVSLKQPSVFLFKLENREIEKCRFNKETLAK